MGNRDFAEGDDCPDDHEESFNMGVSAEIAAEVAKDESRSRPPLSWMHVVSFSSFSKGRGRPRRCPIEVILVQWRNGPWVKWSGEDRTDNGKHPWDVLVMEMLSERHLAQLEAAGTRPEDWLTGEVTRLLKEHGGRF